MGRHFNVIAATFLLVYTIHLGDSFAETPRIKFTLDTTLLSFNKTTLDNGKAVREFTSIGIGETNWGTDHSPEFGFGIGFIPIKNLILGVKLGANGGRYQVKNPGDEENPFDDIYEMKYNTFAYRVLPFVEYKFGLKTVQPFIMATIGYRGGIAYNNDNKDLKQRTHLFAYGGGAGLHFFLVDVLSIDISIVAMGSAGVSIDDLASTNTDTSVKSDLRDFDLSGVVGLSGWL